MSFFTLLTSFGRLAGRALQFAHEQGLDQELINLALQNITHTEQLAPEANQEDKRNAVVQNVMQHSSANESTARLALELAYQIYKNKQNGKTK